MGLTEQQRQLAQTLLEQQVQLTSLDILHSAAMSAHYEFSRHLRFLRHQHESLIQMLTVSGLLADVECFSQRSSHEQEPSCGLAALLALPEAAQCLLPAAGLAAPGQLSAASRELAEHLVAAIYRLGADSGLRLGPFFGMAGDPPDSMSEGCPRAGAQGSHAGPGGSQRKDGERRSRARSRRRLVSPGQAAPKGRVGTGAGHGRGAAACREPRRSLVSLLVQDAWRCPEIVSSLREALGSGAGSETLCRLRHVCRFFRDALPKGEGLGPEDLVRVSGLKSRPDLNGAEGQLIRYDSSAARWHVQLSNGECTRIRAGCLARKEALPSALGSDRPLPDIPRHSRLLPGGSSKGDAARSAILALSLAAFLGLRCACALERCCRAASLALERCMKVCVFLGMDGGSRVQGFAEVFDPVAEHWWELPVHLLALGSGSAVHGRHLYLFGGIAKRGPISSGVRLDLASGDWRPLPPMPRERAHAAVAMLGSWIYACGGISNDLLRAVDRLSARGQGWETMPPLWEARCLGAACALGGCLYVCGGSLGRKASNCLECLRPEAAAKKWELLVPMRDKRLGAAVATLEGSIYACGGYDCVEALRSAERFDPESGRWQALPPMRQARCGATAVAVAGCLYVCGGGGKGGQGPAHCAERFDPCAGCWETLSPSLGPLADAAAVGAGGRLYVCGGSSSDELCQSTVERFDPARGVWEVMPELCYARKDAFAIACAF